MPVEIGDGGGGRTASGAATDVSSAGLEFIARWEGCVLHPYDDGGPGRGNATIGVGHLIHRGPVTEADVRRYAGFTRARALELLHHDVAEAVAAVRALGVALSQCELDALTSFAFNCGPGALAGVAADLRRGDRHAVAAVLEEYVHADGEVVEGLVRHRAAEAELFLAGRY